MTHNIAKKYRIMELLYGAERRGKSGIIPGK